MSTCSVLQLTLVLFFTFLCPSFIHSMLECLICDNVNVTCAPINATSATNMTTMPQYYNCLADTDQCQPQTCNGKGPHICHGTVIFPEGGDFIAGHFTSLCFSDTTPVDCQNETCNMAHVMAPSRKNDLTISCCCHEDQCINGSISFFNDSSVWTTDKEIEDPTSSGTHIAIPIVMGVVGLLLLLLIVVSLLVIIRQNYKDMLRCCSCWKRPAHPVIIMDRAYSPSGYSQPWVLQGLVGQGRYGHVYRALYNGEVVAVKVYSHQNRNSWENERNLFSMESTLHENIVRYVTSESSESNLGVGGVVNSSPLQLYLLTEYYPLGSLLSYLQGNVLSWKQTCSIVRNIACGLKHLHSEFYINSSGIRTEKYPIAHRDMKSSNVLMRSEDGDCVIADLGLALQLVPTNDLKELSNYGQVGTLRYMSPEALEARVNLLDIQSFKQIDIYAFSLIMWEVTSRCCVLTSDEVTPYQFPYGDLVVHPTLDLMKDIVCSRQLRPPIPALWSNHEPLASFAEMMYECWDKDPDARLTAANILYRMNDLCNSSLQNIEDHTHSQLQHHTPINHSQSHTTGIGTVFIQEHSQSSPPPCYSPTDPVPFSAIQNLENRSGMRQARTYFQTSMPHIMQRERDQGGVATEIFTLTPRCTRSLRSSITQPLYGVGGARNNKDLVGGCERPLSVQNSLVLDGRTGSVQDGMHFDSVSEDDTSEGSQLRHNEAVCDSDIADPHQIAAADSGIQISNSTNSHSTNQSPSLLKYTLQHPMSPLNPSSPQHPPQAEEETVSISNETIVETTV